MIDFMSGSHFFNLAFVHNNDAVADVLYNGQVMGNKQGGKLKFFFQIIK